MGTCHILMNSYSLTQLKKLKSLRQTRKQTPLFLSHPLKLLCLPLSSSAPAKDWYSGAYLSPNADRIFIHSNEVNFVAESSQSSTNICKLDVALCNSPREVTESSSFICHFCRGTGPFSCPRGTAQCDLDHQRALPGLCRGSHFWAMRGR